MSGPINSTRPTQLREIGFDTWREWDETIAELRLYFIYNYQDMRTIIPDPLRLHEVAAYKEYKMTVVTDEAEYKALDQNTEIGRDLANFMIQLSQEMMQEECDRQNIEKRKAYSVIRSMCSARLNLTLRTDEEFIACATNDPLQLLAIVKRVIFSRRSPYEIEMHRADAFRDWYNLKMRRGEDVKSYGDRALKIYNKMVPTVTAEGQLPTPAQQGMLFVFRLNDEVESLRSYKSFLNMTLLIREEDYYPKTLIAAIIQAKNIERRR